VGPAAPAPHRCSLLERRRTLGEVGRRRQVRQLEVGLVTGQRLQERDKGIGWIGSLLAAESTGPATNNAATDAAINMQLFIFISLD
jgi:hypothetical protein